MGFTPPVLQKLGFDQTTVAAPGSGDVVGPASSTDNALVRFDGATGKLVQNSAAKVSDTGTVQAAAYNLDAFGNQALYKSGDKLIYGNALDDTIQGSATKSQLAANAYILAGTWYRFDVSKPAILISAENDGKFYLYTCAAGANPIVWSAGTEVGSGGASLSPSYKHTVRSGSTIYSGVNSVSASLADTNWSVVKLTLTGNNRESRTVATATGSMTDPTALSYTPSLNYST